jgi:hypothetical protein
VESIRLAAGDPLGVATFDGVESDSVPSMRLRTTACAEPIYAAPIELKAVAAANAADRSYLGRAGYASTNVYRGQVRPIFSHLSRVLARNPLVPYSTDYFVRFYYPADCAIGDGAFIDWAARILALTIRVAPTARSI